MVLQRNNKAPVWGWADPDTEVTAVFQEQKHKTKATKEGKWLITFKGLRASSTPATLEISSGKDKRVISDVVVGDVWINSGQSNMAYTVSVTTPEEVLSKINKPTIRSFKAQEDPISYKKKLRGNGPKRIRQATPGGFPQLVFFC